MLVLSRKTDESILIDGNIRVTVLGLRGNQVRLGIEAPGQVRILREELWLPWLDPESPGTGEMSAIPSVSPAGAGA